MAADGRFGGHYGVGAHRRVWARFAACASATTTPCGTTIGADADHSCATSSMKGSIAIDGISLTVARLTDADFAVSIIPHTRAETTLSLKRVGDEVNLETDMVGKYVERFLGAPLPPPSATVRERRYHPSISDSAWILNEGAPHGREQVIPVQHDRRGAG